MTETKIIRENPVATKTSIVEIKRTFVIDAMPEPLTPAEHHLQIFDNYIPETDIRLRSIRDPKTKTWSSCLEKRIRVADGFEVSMIDLTKPEYDAFERFEGNEIRKNRYFLESDAGSIEFDIYLGKLWGLNLMTVRFETVSDATTLTTPDYVVVEVTDEQFFDGQNLVNADLEKLRAEMRRLLPA